MSDLPHPPPPTLGEQLGLGPQWQPSPAAWGIAPLNAPDGSKVYVLVLHTSAGSVGAVFTAEGIRAMVTSLTELVSGLTIATAIPTVNGKLHPKGQG